MLKRPSLVHSTTSCVSLLTRTHSYWSRKPRLFSCAQIACCSVLPRAFLGLLLYLGIQTNTQGYHLTSKGVHRLNLEYLHCIHYSCYPCFIEWKERFLSLPIQYVPGLEVSNWFALPFRRLEGLANPYPKTYENAWVEPTIQQLGTHTNENTLYVRVRVLLEDLELVELAWFTSPSLSRSLLLFPLLDRWCVSTIPSFVSVLWSLHHWILNVPNGFEKRRLRPTTREREPERERERKTERKKEGGQRGNQDREPLNITRKVGLPPQRAKDLVLEVNSAGEQVIQQFATGEFWDTYNNSYTNIIVCLAFLFV